MDAIAARPLASRVYPGLDIAALTSAAQAQVAASMLQLTSSAAGSGTAEAAALQLPPVNDPAVLRAVVAAIPGVSESGWDTKILVMRTGKAYDDPKELTAFVDALTSHDDSWPFRVPVDTALVPDYCLVVTKPVGTYVRCARVYFFLDASCLRFLRIRILHCAASLVSSWIVCARAVYASFSPLTCAVVSQI